MINTVFLKIRSGKKTREKWETLRGQIKRTSLPSMVAL